MERACSPDTWECGTSQLSDGRNMFGLRGPSIRVGAGRLYTLCTAQPERKWSTNNRTNISMHTACGCA
eukprot:2917675-Lingulodinium_polyedra.AAC.1